MNKKIILGIFARAFSDTGTYSDECECGKHYHKVDEGYSCKVPKDDNCYVPEKSIAVRTSFGVIEFDGGRYMECCKCWHPKAISLIEFFIKRKHSIAFFFTAYKEQLEKEAKEIQDIKV